MSKTPEDYQRLMLTFSKTLKLFKSHLETMTAINAHMGYKMTQPLIATHVELAQILKDMRIEETKEIN